MNSSGGVEARQLGVEAARAAVRAASAPSPAKGILALPLPSEILGQPQNLTRTLRGEGVFWYNMRLRRS